MVLQTALRRRRLTTVDNQGDQPLWRHRTYLSDYEQRLVIQCFLFTFLVLRPCLSSFFWKNGTDLFPRINDHSLWYLKHIFISIFFQDVGNVPNMGSLCFRLTCYCSTWFKLHYYHTTLLIDLVLPSLLSLIKQNALFHCTTSHIAEVSPSTLPSHKMISQSLLSANDWEINAPYRRPSKFRGGGMDEEEDAQALRRQ